MGVMNRPESSVCLGVWGGGGLGTGKTVRSTVVRTKSVTQPHPGALPCAQQSARS